MLTILIFQVPEHIDVIAVMTVTAAITVADRILTLLGAGPARRAHADADSGKGEEADAVSFFQDRSSPRSRTGAEWVRPPTER